MGLKHRVFAAAVVVTLFSPPPVKAQPACSRSIGEIQAQLRAFDQAALPLGPGFLRDDGLATSLEAFKTRAEGARTPPTGSGLSVEGAKGRLQRFDQRVRRWDEVFASYGRCLNNPGCSIGDVIKAQEVIDPQLADSLKSLSDVGLEQATQRLEKVSGILRAFTAGAGSATTGPIAATLTCMTDGGGSSLSAAAAPQIGATQGPAIEHKAVGCVIAEKFPQVEARFAPPETVAVAKIVFHGEIEQEWYSVSMKAAGNSYLGVLPAPKESLKAFRYYIEVTDKSLETNRTQEFTTTVVGGASDCKGGIVATALATASVLVQGPAGVVALPAGFASAGVVAAGSAAGSGSAVAGGGGAGLSAAAIAGIAGGVGAAAVVAKAASGGGGGSTSTSGSGGSGAAPTATPAPAPTFPTMSGQWDGLEDWTIIAGGVNTGRCTLTLQVTTQSGGSFSGTGQRRSCSFDLPGFTAADSSGPFTGLVTTGGAVTFPGFSSPPAGCSVTGGSADLVGTVSGTTMSARSQVSATCSGASVSWTITISLTRR